jgi:hypothetical protein
MRNHLCNHEEILNRKETGEARLHRMKSDLDAIANQPFAAHHINLLPRTLATPPTMLVDLGFRGATTSSKLLTTTGDMSPSTPTTAMQ